MVVNERKYTVRVEEEDTFRTVALAIQVSSAEVNSENEEENDEVDSLDDDRDASKNKKGNAVDDMEILRNEISDDRAKINEEEAERIETNGINGSHQSELGKEPVHIEPPDQRKTVEGKHLENHVSCENNNEESTNSAHGLFLLFKILEVH